MRYDGYWMVSLLSNFYDYFGEGIHRHVRMDDFSSSSLSSNGNQKSWFKSAVSGVCKVGVIYLVARGAYQYHQYRESQKRTQRQDQVVERYFTLPSTSSSSSSSSSSSFKSSPSQPSFAQPSIEVTKTIHQYRTQLTYQALKEEREQQAEHSRRQEWLLEQQRNRVRMNLTSATAKRTPTLPHSPHSPLSLPHSLIS